MRKNILLRSCSITTMIRAVCSAHHGLPLSELGRGCRDRESLGGAGKHSGSSGLLDAASAGRPAEAVQCSSSSTMHKIMPTLQTRAQVRVEHVPMYISSCTYCGRVCLHRIVIIIRRRAHKAESQTHDCHHPEVSSASPVIAPRRRAGRQR